MKILQVNTTDRGGGAERVMMDLWRSYNGLGHVSWLAVGRRNHDHPAVISMPDLPTPGLPAYLAHAAARGLGGGTDIGARGFLVRRLEDLARYPAPWDKWRGTEDFNFPGSWRLLELAPELPDIVHCHNLHGRYFDPRFLPELSRRVPVVMTLHDVWTITGHCAYTLGCERWEQGCGACPDLTTYPAIRRDRTHENWSRKKEIYAASRFYVATPSRWLMAKVERSILGPAVAMRRIVPNGVDLSLFRPGDKNAVRRKLNIPQRAGVLLFTAQRITGHRFKDYPTLRQAVSLAAKRMPERQLVFLAVGQDGPPQREGTAEIRFVPYQEDLESLVMYYQAADLYVHAAREEAENFPLSVLEALACGLPVVATAVGGIPEQIEDMDLVPRSEATGVLTPPGDAVAMAGAVSRLIGDEELCQALGRNARHQAERRFDLVMQTQDYLEWYASVIDDWNRWRGGLSS